MDINYKDIEAKKSKRLFEGSYYAVVKAGCTLGQGQTKEDALADALYEMRCESDDALEYDENRIALIVDIENSEKHAGTCANRAHFIKL